MLTLFNIHSIYFMEKCDRYLWNGQLSLLTTRRRLLVLCQHTNELPSTVFFLVGYFSSTPGPLPAPTSSGPLPSTSCIPSDASAVPVRVTASHRPSQPSLPPTRTPRGHRGDMSERWASAWWLLSMDRESLVRRTGQRWGHRWGCRRCSVGDCWNNNNNSVCCCYYYYSFRFLTRTRVVRCRVQLLFSSSKSIWSITVSWHSCFGGHPLGGSRRPQSNRFDNQP